MKFFSQIKPSKYAYKQEKMIKTNVIISSKLWLRRDVIKSGAVLCLVGLFKSV